MRAISVRPRRCATALRSVLASRLFASILHAQAPAPTYGGALEEVVVTAQKRAEAL